MNPFSAHLVVLVGGIVVTSSCWGEQTNSTSTATQTEPSPGACWIDRMEDTRNSLGGRCAIYRMAPDNILYSKSSSYGRDGTAGLKLIYKKVNTGGPYGQGGWIGYYTTLKKGDKYFNAAAFTHLTMWVRGDKGGENFKVGIADKQFGMMEDSPKSNPIGRYLPEKKITTDWQKASIPLRDIFVDYNLVESVSIAFENDLFEGDQSEGTVYIDDMAFETVSEPASP